MTEQWHSAARWWGRIWLPTVLAVHWLLIAGIAWNSSPNVDEAAHLASGFFHWQTGRFDAYCVNPPLVRMACTLPLLAVAPRYDLSPLQSVSLQRIEWQLGEQLLDAWTVEQTRRYLWIARMVNAGWSTIGAIYVFRWARDLWGPVAGRAALTLWCFCPHLLAWTATVCPDVAGAALAVAACYHWRSVAFTGGRGAIVNAGLFTGLAMLAKSTCLFLPVFYLFTGTTVTWGARVVAWGQVTLVAWAMVVMGYGGEQLGVRCDSVPWCHPWLQEWTTAPSPESPSWGRTLVRLPLPLSMVRGLDLQLADFRRGQWSYCFGEWRERGWWFYYLAAAAVKLPLGYLFLAAQAVWQTGRDSWRSDAGQHTRRQELRSLLVPLVGFLLVVSSQTGFSHHFRYAFPTLPFLYILASRPFLQPQRCSRAVGCLVLGVASSLYVWPASHSYFHEAVGGPAMGHRFLLESNLEWGEDLYEAAAWVQRHPESRPIYRALLHDLFARRMHVDWQATEGATIRPGWYLVSVQRTLDPRDRFFFLSQMTPVTQIGHSLRVYDLTDDRCRVAKRVKGQEGETCEPAHWSPRAESACGFGRKTCSR